MSTAPSGLVNTNQIRHSYLHYNYYIIHYIIHNTLSTGHNSTGFNSAFELGFQCNTTVACVNVHVAMRLPHLVNAGYTSESGVDCLISNEMVKSLNRTLDLVRKFFRLKKYLSNTYINCIVPHTIQIYINCILLLLLLLLLLLQVVTNQRRRKEMKSGETKWRVLCVCRENIIDIHKIFLHKNGRICTHTVEQHMQQWK